MISFGLVSIPVDLYTAVSPKSVSFHLIHAKCGTRIKEQLVCPNCEIIVSRQDIVRGYEFAKDQYLQLTEEELEALEHEGSERMDILEFVPLASVDPTYFERTYYLGPRQGGDKPYQLLAVAMAKAGRGALAKFVRRGKEHLVLIRAVDNGLLLHTMYHSDEIRNFAEIDKGHPKTTEAELSLAIRLIEELSSDRFRPERYKDEYRQRVLELVSRKAEGKPITAPPRARPAQVINLIDALQASLERTPAKGERPEGKAHRPRGTPAKRAHDGKR